MFLPLGFGTWPRVFPVAIILLALTCVVWSHIFFPAVRIHKNNVGKIQTMDSAELKSLQLLVVRKACNAKFDNNMFCDPKNQPDSEKLSQNLFKPVLESVEILKFVQAFRGHPDTWPEEAKKIPEYNELWAEVERIEHAKTESATLEGLTTQDNISLFTLLKASFTHANYMHLMGNLLFLIVFGVWVEQCVGALLALLIFFAGSFCGIGLQLFLSPNSAVLGASAGVTALMGAFFALFLRSEFQFMFTFVFVYFKRISMPLITVFPFFYMLSDISAVMTYQANSGIAHWAHVIGLAIGFAFGMLYKQMISFKESQYFVQEAPFLRTLRKGQDPSDLWAAFKSVMYWNCQNWRAVESFLRKTQVYSISFDDDNDKEFFKKHLTNYFSYTFRRGTIDEMIRAVQMCPPQLALAPYIPQIPVSQILHVADRAAKMQMFEVAMPLYLTSLLRLKDPKQIEAVRKAVEAIHTIQGTRPKVVGG